MIGVRRRPLKGTDIYYKIGYRGWQDRCGIFAFSQRLCRIAIQGGPCYADNYAKNRISANTPLFLLRRNGSPFRIHAAGRPTCGRMAYRMLLRVQFTPMVGHPRGRHPGMEQVYVARTHVTLPEAARRCGTLYRRRRYGSVFCCPRHREARIFPLRRTQYAVSSQSPQRSPSGRSRRALQRSWYCH